MWDCKHSLSIVFGCLKYRIIPRLQMRRLRPGLGAEGSEYAEGAQVRSWGQGGEAAALWMHGAWRREVPQRGGQGCPGAQDLGSHLQDLCRLHRLHAGQCAQRRKATVLQRALRPLAHTFVWLTPPSATRACLLPPLHLWGLINQPSFTLLKTHDANTS